MSDTLKIPDDVLKAAALAIHCRLNIGRGNFIGGERPTSTSEVLARVALVAALPLLACSCPVISDVDDYCPQHGREA